ncbi:MbtH domain protein [bacterium AH-315-K03]|nr:MbtH domain protein [bacterium AH-315-K03]
MNKLIEQLSKKQAIVGGGNFRGIEAFKEQIDKDYVFIKFTEPYGDVDLAIHPDKETSDWESADFENATGVVHLEGEIGLNYVKCRLVADVNLDTLKGEGYLVPIEEMPESADYEAAKLKYENMDKENA